MAWNYAAADNGGDVANKWLVRQIRDFPCQETMGARIWNPSASMRDVEIRYIERFAPGSHSLDHEAVILSLSSPISLEIDGRNVVVTRGDFTRLAPYITYAWDSAPEEEWKYFIFYPR